MSDERGAPVGVCGNRDRGPYPASTQSSRCGRRESIGGRRMPISPLVQLAKKREGEEKNVILSESGGHYDIKQVVVVGTDVDVHDSAGIEWAITTRFRADRDLV